MWCKCVSKYGICDINTIVNIKDSFTVAEMSHIPHVHTYLHPNFHAVKGGQKNGCQLFEGMYQYRL